MRSVLPKKCLLNIDFAGAALHNPKLHIIGIMRCTA
jgi:hypothetical protein